MKPHNKPWTYAEQKFSEGARLGFTRGVRWGFFYGVIVGIVLSVFIAAASGRFM